MKKSRTRKFDEIWNILSRTEEPDHKKEWLLTNMRLYEKTLEHLKDGMNILEIGCGKGYGTFFLAKNLPGSEVVGLDINKEGIEFGRRTWNSKNLNFDVIDILYSEDIEKIKRRYDNFNAVICFEVLEHISPDKTADFFSNIRPLLVEGGMLFLSTPNKRVYDIDTYTEDHINERNYEELTSLFEKIDFKITATFGIFSLNKIALHLLLKLNLVHRMEDEHINLSAFQWLIRIVILSIFAPNRLYSEVLKRTNRDKWIQYKYELANLRKKEIQNSIILLFILKKKMR